jgi:hypothetical protein
MKGLTAMTKISRQFPLPEVADGGSGAADGLSRTDQLEYLADLALELKEIADNLGCSTLAGVLVVAYREAIIQAQRR